MSSVAEIDKAGRLVVPKKLRDALHLIPGTRIILRQEGDAILMEPERTGRGLYLKNGIPVYDAGPAPQMEDRDWVEQFRNERAEGLIGDLSKF